MIWYFALNGVTVADSDSDWDEDDCESIWTERRFDLGTEDGRGDLINDKCDKYDNDDDCDDCGDNTSCNVPIIKLRIWCFHFSLGEAVNTKKC